jgi:Protein of unknown function (DUF3253)
MRRSKTAWILLSRAARGLVKPPGAALDAVASLAHHPRMPDEPQANDTPASLDDTILTLCRATAPGRTICPTDAAQAFATAWGEDELGWRSHLTDVRRTAVRLAHAGRLIIYRKGKPADPHDFRGVYRLGLPSRD